MGYLTTFTIYSDGIDLIKKDSDQFCEKLYSAALSGKTQDVGHMGFVNLVRVQKTRHADDHALYIHMGNCVTMMNSYDSDTKELAKRHPDFVRQMIKYAEQQVKEMKRMMKELENE